MPIVKVKLEEGVIDKKKLRGECPIANIDMVGEGVYVNHFGKREDDISLEKSVGLRWRGAEEVCYSEI